MHSKVLVGSGQYKYELVTGWGNLPEGWVLGQTGIVTDRQDRVYLSNRSEHPLVVLDSEGNFLNSWGEDVLVSPHGMFIDAEENLYLPLMRSHVVLKYDVHGKLLMTLGEWNKPSNPEWSGQLTQYFSAPAPRSYGPFCAPTDAGVAADGTIYVSDGYGNASVHRFTPDGQLIASFGQPGKSGPGRFHTPHCAWVHSDGRTFVADRENQRVQIFTPDGAFLEQWEGFENPCDIFIDSNNIVYVAEGGGAAMTDAMVSILNIGGEFLTRWRGPFGDCGHAIWVDSMGSIYVNQNREGQRLLKFQPVG